MTEQDIGRDEVWYPIRLAPRDGSLIVARATEPGWSATRLARFKDKRDRLPAPEDGSIWPSVPTEWRNSECPFCNIHAITSPVREFDQVVSFEPLNPVVPGHILVVPRAHVANFAVEPEIAAIVMNTAARLAAEMGGDCNVITSKGEAATQTVQHFHVHLVPRRDGDGLMLPWSGPSQ